MSSIEENKLMPCIISLKYYFILLFFAYIISIFTPVSAQVYTDKFCNFDLYPKTGCEDQEGAQCINNKCLCKSENKVVVLGRFCFKSSCSAGQYYHRYEEKCRDQKRASSKPEENSCHYDYHCFGPNVHCKQYGWNRNCVCDPGFSYDQFTGICKPKYGIGGHCKKDTDCDETNLRNMFCDMANSTNPKTTVDHGTCECLPEHRYNYNIDGCEPISQILKRENQMRTLILVFISAGLVLGLILTCNFNICGQSDKNSEIILKRLALEQERKKRIQEEKNLSNCVEKTKQESVDLIDDKKQTPEKKDSALISL